MKLNLELLDNVKGSLLSRIFNSYINEVELLLPDYISKTNQEITHRFHSDSKQYLTIISLDYSISKKARKENNPREDARQCENYLTDLYSNEVYLIHLYVTRTEHKYLKVKIFLI